jgi:hypothetical protein
MTPLYWFNFSVAVLLTLFVAAFSEAPPTAIEIVTFIGVAKLLLETK